MDSSCQTSPSKGPSPWAWVPTLYFGQGLPYVTAMTLSVVFYKNMGISNATIALCTSWFYLPWVIKPLWSPWVDLIGTKRAWVISLQAALAVSFALIGAAAAGPAMFPLTVAMFMLMALASATHDIAADGFYLLALPERQQASFIGVRSSCYRAAMIAGQGGLLLVAGKLTERTGNPKQAWMYVFLLAAAAFGSLFAWHRHAMPRPAADGPAGDRSDLMRGALATFKAFFARRDIVMVLAYLLTFRLGEAQAVKLIAPFLLDPRERGGLGLTTAHVGLVYGTIGIACLTLGGIAGGFVIARVGLKRAIWPLTLACHLPNAAFILLAAFQPTSLFTVSSAIAFEQFGYGFGFTVYLMYLVLVSEGPYRTAHYAIGTGFMAMGMMLPGMLSGWVQAKVGYLAFFVWVCLNTLPSIILTAFLKIDPRFGMKDRT